MFNKLCFVFVGVLPFLVTGTSAFGQQPAAPTQQNDIDLTGKNYTNDYRWDSWRHLCNDLGKCFFGNNYYISQKSDKARFSDGYIVRKVSREEYLAHEFRGTEDGLNLLMSQDLQGKIGYRAVPLQATVNRSSKTNKLIPTTRNPGPQKMPPSKPTRNPVRQNPTAPKQQAIAGSANIKGCQGLRSIVLEKAKRCMAQSGVTLKASCPLTLFDAEEHRFFVIKDGQCIMNEKATHAGRSGASHSLGSIDAKPGSTYGTTPAGLFMTTVHGCCRYNKRTSVGLKCAEKGRNKSKGCVERPAKGVIIHGETAANGKKLRFPARTLGCTRLTDTNFKRYHQIMAGGTKSCPYFNYFNEGTCGGATARQWGSRGRQQHSKRATRR